MRTTSWTREVEMDGTTLGVTYLGVISMLCAGIAIISATKKQWILVTIFGIFAVAAFAAAYSKPSIDRRRDLARRHDEQEVLGRYPEIRKILDLDSGMMEISYINLRGEHCSTTMVSRDGKLLVNTQTADCST